MTTPTDPLDGILLPFSVPMYPTQGSYALTIPAGFRNNNSSQTIRIPAGVSLIRLTWNGIESLRYRVDRTVNGQTVAAPWKVLIDSTTEITPRSAPPIEVALTHPGILWVQLGIRASQATVGAGCSAGATIIPTGGPII